MPATGGPTVIRGGTVVDGTGRPAWPADLLLSGGMIEAVLPPGAGAAGEVVDAQGLVVCPGFIDAHTHDDALVLQSSPVQPKLAQGVATVVTGNCGISLAPLRRQHSLPPLDILGRASLSHESFAGYLAQLDRARPPVNVVPLVGQIAVRVSNVRDLDREADAGERALMRADIEQALDAGAFGLSTGVYYPPARAASREELVDICRPLQGRPAVLAMHIRDEADAIDEAMREALHVAGSCGARLVLSHHKVVGRPNFGRTSQTLAVVEAAAREGDVCVDCYPYEASSTMLDPDKAERIADVLISWSSAYPGMAGRRLADIAGEWQVGLREAAARLVPGGAIYFGLSPQDVDRVVAHPLAMIGSDGLPHDRSPHPRLWGTFPRVLGHYVRTRGLLTLEAAIHKMTGLPARKFGLARRGRIQAGFHADLTLFDPRVVSDNATYQDPTRAPTGIHSVYVNGRLAMSQGRCIDLHAGERLKPLP